MTSTSTSGCFSNPNENTCPHKSSYVNDHSSMFMIVKMWKQPKYLSTRKWINKMRWIHTMEYYSAIKWMSCFYKQPHGWLKNITLDKRSQIQKNTYYMIPFLWSSRTGQRISMVIKGCLWRVKWEADWKRAQGDILEWWNFFFNISFL